MPVLVIPWWDLKSQKLMRVTLPTVTWEVDPSPGSGADASAAAGEAANRQRLWWMLGATLQAAWERRQMTHRSSESHHFAHLLDSCRTGDAKEAYNALLGWLDCTHHGTDTATIDDFLARHPDPELRRQMEALQERMLVGAIPWDGEALVDALRRARGPHIRPRSTADGAQLPPLNPR